MDLRRPGPRDAPGLVLGAVTSKGSSRGMPTFTFAVALALAPIYLWRALVTERGHHWLLAAVWLIVATVGACSGGSTVDDPTGR